MTTTQISAGFKLATGLRRPLEAATDRSAPAAAPREAHVFTTGVIETPLGAMLAIVDDRGLHRLEFLDDHGIEEIGKELCSRPENKAAVVMAGNHRFLTKLKQELADYFAGTRKAFTVPPQGSGTDFEKRAWQYLNEIPYGHTRSYGEQARGIGNPAAARAVGRANGRNPIGLIVPCHRVIGAAGTLTGYGGGLARKQWLLDHERKFNGHALFD